MPRSKPSALRWIISMFFLSGLAALVVQGILSCNSQNAVQDEQIKTLKESQRELRSDMNTGFKGVNDRLDKVLQDRVSRVASRQLFGPTLQ